MNLVVDLFVYIYWHSNWLSISLAAGDMLCVKKVPDAGYDNATPPTHPQQPLPITVGHFEFIFYKVNFKWWSVTFSLVLIRKLQSCCRSKDT